MKALALLSGGLDSRLAISLVKEQDIEVEAVHFKTIFCTCDRRRGCVGLEAQDAAEKLGVRLHLVNNTKEFIEAVKNPKFGYGSGMNPCLDCRIIMFRKAKELMERIGASFLVTGEVLGQRPMSQHLRAMRLIEREAGVEGLVVRPLSARLLPPSIPERLGWVRREKFLAIRGRSRKEQMALAKERGLDYPCPAGGCLLTDPNFAKRVRDLLSHKPDADVFDFLLLKLGRHFRLSEGAKLIVGRNEGENARLKAMAPDGDWLIEPVGRPGPSALLRVEGEVGEDVLRKAASIVARYTDGSREGPVMVALRKGGEERELLPALPASEEEIEALRI